MKTVLITGGAGLVGSWVARKLVKKGYRVIVYDNFAQYVSPFKNRIKNYLELRYHGIVDNVIFVRGDTTNISQTRRMIMQHTPEYILHLGGMPVADLSNHHVEEAVQSILMGTINILEIIKDYDYVKKFVYVSSSMAYGNFEIFPCPEDHTMNPKDIYGGSKYAGEIMTQTFARRFNIPICIVRPSAIYGPWDINRRVSQIFVENALRGKELRLDGGGKLVFDFTYVKDAADGIILALLKSNAIGQIFNITYGQGYSLLEFVTILKNIIPSVSYRIVEKKDENRPIRGALSIERAKRLLGFSPKYPLEKGLRLYIEAYKNLGIFINSR